MRDAAVTAAFSGSAKAFNTLETGTEIRTAFVPDLISTMLSALKPSKIWMIVVLVSISGISGYVLIKIVGAGAGIGLTGMIGGLASSTVTTLTFAGRSKDLLQLDRIFAVAVIPASSIMFLDYPILGSLSRVFSRGVGSLVGWGLPQLFCTRFHRLYG